MKKIILGILALVLFIGAIVAYKGYSYIFSPNVSISQGEHTLLIPSGSSYDDVLSIIDTSNIVDDIGSFAKVAAWMSYQKEKVPAGKYQIKNGWSNKELVGVLRSGRQAPVKITYNQCRTIYNLAARITQGIELDSASLIDHLLLPSTLEEVGYNENTIITMFIPNTYEVYWNITKEELISKMKKEHKLFWSNTDRQAKLKALDLNEIELYTLASIVEKETLAPSERKKVAGLYINRLQRGMKLEADPTVVFATGLFELRRVRFKHLEVDSPFNTYRNLGLPPGPIFMPDISTMDATLNYEDHEYIFFCAKPDNSGLHAFAKTNAGHEANARRYHQYLNKRKIR